MYQLNSYVIPASKNCQQLIFSVSLLLWGSMNRAIETKADHEDPPIHNKPGSRDINTKGPRPKICDYQPDFIWSATVTPPTLNLLEPDQGKCNTRKLSLPRKETFSPVLEISFGPPDADFGSIWSSHIARNFRHVQKTSKVRTLYFDPQSLNHNKLLLPYCFYSKIKLRS